MDRHPAHGGAITAVVISLLLLVGCGGNQGPGEIGAPATIPTAAPVAAAATPAAATPVAVTPVAVTPSASAAAVAAPPLACPPEPGLIDLAGLLVIPAEKRLACLGRTEVTFVAWVVPQMGRGGTCVGEPAWLTCRLNVPADQLAATEGADDPTLGVIPDPDAIMPAPWEGILPAGTWVRVTGHFDDPAAATCAGATFQDVDTPALLVRWCRALFVATRVTAAP